jgi:hypothetical protein
MSYLIGILEGTRERGFQILAKVMAYRQQKVPSLFVPGRSVIDHPVCHLEDKWELTQRQ